MEDEETFQEFYKITKLTNIDPIDYVCTAQISKMITRYLLKKYNNTCVFMGGDFFTISGLKSKIDLILNQYKECAAQGLLLCIMVDIENGAHRNILIFNPILNTIEYYEPHGTVQKSEGIFDFILTLEEYFNSHGVYINADLDFSIKACPIITSPKDAIGIQHYEKINIYGESDYYHAPDSLIDIQTNPYKSKLFVQESHGFCCIWSWLVMEFRILYPKETIETYGRILKKLLDPRIEADGVFRARSLNSFIRGYTFELMKNIVRNVNAYLPDDYQIGRDVTLSNPVSNNLDYRSDYRSDYIEATDRTIEDISNGIKKIKLFRNVNGNFGIITGSGENKYQIVDVSENLEKYDIKNEYIIGVNDSNVGVPILATPLGGGKVVPYNNSIDFINSKDYFFNSVVLTFEL